MAKNTQLANIGAAPYAAIVGITIPATFVPNVEFTVKVVIRNHGAAATGFSYIINRDTGLAVDYKEFWMEGNYAITTVEHTVSIPQTTDFHGLVMTGHKWLGMPISDETKEFTVPVYVPTPPEEGMAVITKLEVPDSFVPGTDVPFMALVKNTGGDDDFFFRIVNTDTGDIVCSTSSHLRSGRTWEIPALKCRITQETDFHGRAEAGHIE